MSETENSQQTSARQFRIGILRTIGLARLRIKISQPCIANLTIGKNMTIGPMPKKIVQNIYPTKKEIDYCHLKTEFSPKQTSQVNNRKIFLSIKSLRLVGTR